MKLLQKQNKNGNRGFTVMELLIATTVFSVVLLVALTGFLQMGRIFYKGISVTQTQQVASDIINDVTESLQGDDKVEGPYTWAATGYKYLCIGNIRYTYPDLSITSNAFVDTSRTDEFSSTTGIGMVRDVLPGGSTCKVPCSTTSPPTCTGGTGIRWNNPVEMLGDRMRLEVFDFASTMPDYYNVKVVVFYGDEEDWLLETAGDRNTVTCQGTSRTKSFCAVGRYSTSVYKGRRT